ncbi:MAG TPA: hypothetical protein VM866_04665 [Pyrinomonadaceae bacterium]|jgi:outer membrane biosynthesis protein TonB|nr:hypothetical protein [Pyrinomonadaceae bacterium]
MAEIFQNYEIHRAPHFRPRLVRLVAGSFMLHALFVATLLYVPAAQRMFHLAGMFSGADYVEEDYTTGAIRERAQIIQISNPDKLYYPPGYFNQNAPAEPEIVAEVRPEPSPTPKPVKPKPSPKPSLAPTPSPTPVPTPIAAEEVAQTGSSAEDAAKPALTEEEQKAKDDQAQKETLDKLAAQNKTKLPPKINAKPYKDLLAKYNQKWLDGHLDLSGTIQVTLEADRNEDGTLTNMVMTGGSASDPILKEMAKDVVQALSASHALAFLEGAERLRMTLTLDQKKLSVSADTVLDSEQRAKDMANVYTAGIVYQRWKTGGKDEGAVWKSTSVAAQGSKVTVKFEMPRDTAGELLAKQLPPA